MKLKSAVIVFLSCLMFGVSMASPDGIDINKSITIGNGPKTVFEFTDPDCPFCRKASKYFEGRTDLTRHIFLFPLPRHPKAKEKAQYILSQDDKAKAYHAVMSGSMDHVGVFASTAKGVSLQQEQFDIAKKSKISATPTFIINGRIIEGFEVKKFVEALGPKP